MTAILDWVKNIFCFTIVMTALYHLLPNKNYEKYVRFFGGIIMTILVMAPVLHLFSDEKRLEELLDFNNLEMQRSQIESEIEGMEREKGEYLSQEYESAIRQDIEMILSEQGVGIERTDIQLSETYEVEELHVKLSEGAARMSQEISQMLGDYYNIEEADIVIE